MRGFSREIQNEEKLFLKIESLFPCALQIKLIYCKAVSDTRKDTHDKKMGLVISRSDQTFLCFSRAEKWNDPQLILLIRNRDRQLGDSKMAKRSVRSPKRQLSANLFIKIQVTSPTLNEGKRKE